MNKKYKVRLTVVTNSPAMAEVRGNWSIVQEVGLTAEDCANNFVKTTDVEAFVFGNVLVYTSGVQAFVFEDVED